jgi:hypothetical protein
LALVETFLSPMGKAFKFTLALEGVAPLITFKVIGALVAPPEVCG